MGYAKLKTKISVDDYLSVEEVSPVRHEYISGEVYAMAGASQNHNRIAGSLFNLISRGLESSSREVYAGGMKVMVDADVIYYPDLFVSCEGSFANPYYSQSPTLIIEVISPSTEHTDRREKLVAYQKMPSVHEVVLVAQEKIAVEIHRRQADGQWITYYFDRSDEEFTLDSVELTLKLTEVYRWVAFENQP